MGVCQRLYKNYSITYTINVLYNCVTTYKNYSLFTCQVEIIELAKNYQESSRPVPVTLHCAC